MSELTCIVAGGGFAGIHAVKAISKAQQERLKDRRLRIILIDMQPSHQRKVLLFRPAVAQEDINVPWQRILPDGVQFIQGTITALDNGDKCLYYTDSKGARQSIKYDILVAAVGSVIKQSGSNQGGIPLAGFESGVRIRELWHSNLRLAAAESREKERTRLMTAAVAGAGITGIETAAELAFAMRAEAGLLGLDPAHVKVHLINAQDRLFLEAPLKVGRKLESLLEECGVTVHHGKKALREEEGQLMLSDGTPIPVGTAIWTLGLAPNPVIRSLQIPVTSSGQAIVDESYRVRDMHGVYSIGDCANIVDPKTGAADRMTCKEAIPQANRLGSIIMDDLTGQTAPVHKALFESFTVGLGPGRGLVWTRKWGIDFMITGKLAYKIKLYVWDFASLLK